MPSRAMQESIDALRERQQASAGQAPPPLEELRAGFVPGDRLHPVPDDVLVTEVAAGGVPAHWLAARLGRAAGMRVLFPEYRLAPEQHFPAAIDDVLAAWRRLRADQGLSASAMAVAGDSAGGGLAVALLVALRDAGEALPAAAALMSPTVDLTSSGASMGRSRGRRGPSGRPGPASRLPAPARHPRGSRGHRADRAVPAGPGPLAGRA